MKTKKWSSKSGLKVYKPRIYNGACTIVDIKKVLLMIKRGPKLLYHRWSTLYLSEKFILLIQGNS